MKNFICGWNGCRSDDCEQQRDQANLSLSFSHRARLHFELQGPGTPIEMTHRRSALLSTGSDGSTG